MCKNNEGLGGVSPRRSIIRREAAKALQSQAKIMQQLALRKMGRLPVVGDIVQLKIPDVDRGKMDASCLTAIVIEVTEAGMFRLATRAGVIRPCMNAASLQLVPSSVAPSSLGLEGILDNDMALLKDDNGAWKDPKPIRTHANAASVTGGQGMTKCSCTGKCNTNHCSCRRAGRECSSRCHNKNNVCCNLVCRE